MNGSTSFEERLSITAIPFQISVVETALIAKILPKNLAPPAVGVDWTSVDQNPKVDSPGHRHVVSVAFTDYCRGAGLSYTPSK